MSLIISQEDKIVSELTTLYQGRGFKRFKPACFEDYSLYLSNIDFLISKNVITFSGAGGRLLALRPDVTLSVISHARDESGINKLFYNEKVYRRTDDKSEFREVSQMGAEVYGDVDSASEAEIIVMSLKTLQTISDDFVLDLSHMGYTEGLISSFCSDDEQKQRAYTYLKSKNLHDFEIFAEEIGAEKKYITAFKAMSTIGGNAAVAVEAAYKNALNDQMRSAAVKMKELVGLLRQLGYGERININFSIANNADYYNGIIFNGYVGGVPKMVLSGGRYDKLLKRLKKSGGAIGFALYLGELERYFKPDAAFVDKLIIYDDKCVLEALKTAEELTSAGKTIKLSKSEGDTRYGEVIDMREVAKC